ncbi:uncharacterized protein BCR38DRAFT_337046 [Pseudomassariella vexata]|uniref:SGNH hydrolase-type esterase domain-containing protein n=1 Tax=Pseudomassariella vexata TaxID=1141098 RepID=A0A1Y2E7X0_9PEZI|nr:uncharacterized protein BCR38DRAFT_337046 [Pseudomassariella vexata]ORY67673.1 hypothetical protein BCR38DRAFT_337046 [Pseudomassariella vexata]
MIRHIQGALGILLREDLGYGAVTDWNFHEPERRDCFCLNQFNVRDCSGQGIYKTADVLKHDPRGLACPKLIPGWNTDLTMEQINQFPIPVDEYTRLKNIVRMSPFQTRRAFVLGQGLWNNLDMGLTKAWLNSVLEVTREGPNKEAPTLLVTPNASGKYKQDKWIVTQGTKALAIFEEEMGHVAETYGIDSLGTWNMSIQATLYDGVHLDMRGNLLKAMMVMNWLAALEA